MYHILVNVKKYLMLTFDYTSRISVKPILIMEKLLKTKKEILYVTKCNYLGNILSTICSCPSVDHAV